MSFWVGAEQPREGAAGGGQLRRAPLFDDLRPVEDDDAVSLPRQLQPVRHDDRRAVPHDRHVTIEHLPGCRRVERGRGLVEHEHGRLGEEGAGDGDPLSLARRQRPAPLAHRRVIAVRQTVHKRGEARGANRRRQLVIGRLGSRVPQVLGERGMKDEGLLVDECDVSPDVLERQVPQIVAVEQDPGRRPDRSTGA